MLNRHRPSLHGGQPDASAQCAGHLVARVAQIAIHGRDNLGGILGAAESHGCMLRRQRSATRHVGPQG